MAKFSIHTNRELRDSSGKPMKFYTERSYTSELKKRGLEQFDERTTHTYKRKPYAGVSEEAHRMMSSVTYDAKGKPNVGDRYYDALKKMGVSKVPDRIKNETKGGCYAD